MDTVRYRFRALLVAIAFVLACVPAWAEEAPAEPAGPDVDKVLQELASIGPDALVARLNEMRAQVDAKAQEAEALRAQAEAAAAEAESIKQRIATIENFTKAVTEAMAPAETPAEPQQVAEEQPAEPKTEGEG